VPALKNPRHCGVFVCNEPTLVWQAVQEMHGTVPGGGEATEEQLVHEYAGSVARADGTTAYQAVGRPKKEFRRRQASGVGMVLTMIDGRPGLPGPGRWCPTQTFIEMRRWLKSADADNLPHVRALLRASLVVTFDPFWLVFSILQGRMDTNREQVSFTAPSLERSLRN
jgi:hypothetical protein